MAVKRANNEGSITRLPSGSWRAQASVAGKRLSHTGKTKEDCAAWLREVINQADQGLSYGATKQTLGEYLQEWIEIKETELRPKTAQQYRQYIEKRITPKLGHIQLYALRLQQIEKFYNGLVKEGAGKRSVHYIHRVLHGALEKAAKSGLLPRNPAHGATLPRVEQREMNALDEAQVTQFLVEAYDTRFEALYRLAAATGMREGELLGLKWMDIDWVKGVISIRRQLQRITQQGLVFGEPKTRAGRRSVRIGQNGLDSLNKHRQRQQLEIAYAGERWQDHDLVFPSSIGTPLDSRNMVRDFHATLKRAGLPAIRFHDLRHTAASLMISHETPVNVVTSILGHSKPSVTLDIYAHVYSGRQEQVAKLMDDLVAPMAVGFTQNALRKAENTADARLHTVAHEKPKPAG